jgi:uncharacterized coiled-coil protein SlyX
MGREFFALGQRPEGAAELFESGGGVEMKGLIFALIGIIIVVGGIMFAVENAKINGLNAQVASQKTQIESQKEDLSRLADQQKSSLAENRDLSRRVSDLESLAQSQKSDISRLADQQKSSLAENRDLLKQVEELTALAESQKKELSVLAAQNDETLARIRNMEGSPELPQEESSPLSEPVEGFFESTQEGPASLPEPDGAVEPQETLNGTELEPGLSPDGAADQTALGDQE